MTADIGTPLRFISPSLVPIYVLDTNSDFSIVGL